MSKLETGLDLDINGLTGQHGTVLLNLGMLGSGFKSLQLLAGLI